jgi:hypothetical protein
MQEEQPAGASTSETNALKLIGVYNLFSSNFKR